MTDINRDTIDRLVGIDHSSNLYITRHQRDKVAHATQGSEIGLFDPNLPGLSLQERLLAALLACHVTPNEILKQEYLDRLATIGTPRALIKTIIDGHFEILESKRLEAVMRFTHTLITDPIRADRTALLKLKEAGLSTPEIVTLAQLIAFISYQIRLAAGLSAMKSLER